MTSNNSEQELPPVYQETEGEEKQEITKLETLLQAITALEARMIQLQEELDQLKQVHTTSRKRSNSCQDYTYIITKSRKYVIKDNSMYMSESKKRFYSDSQI